jgi:MFS family permease
METPSVRSPSRAPVRRLAVARVISLSGGGAAFTALNFTIYERTGSAAWLAATLLLTFGVAGFLGPFAGTLGDRFDRRRVMIWSDLAGAVCFGAMALVDGPRALVGAAFLASVAETPFWPASGAAIPNLAGEENIGWANSLLSMSRYAGIVIGPALGGTLLSLIGPSSVFALNGASFVVSAVLVATVHGRFSAPRSSDVDERRRTQLTAGIRFLLHEPFLRTLMLAWVVFILGMGMGMVGDVPLAALFHAGSSGYGAIIALWAGGSILGSFVARRMHERAEPRWLVIATFGLAAAGFGIALAPAFWFVLVMNLAFGFGDGVTVVAEQNLLQRRSPDAVRSSVMGAFEGGIHGMLAVSYLAAAFVLPALGVRWLYALGGVSGIGAGVVLLRLLSLARRSSDQLEPVGSPASPLSE